MNGELQVISVEALTTVGGVVVLTQIVYALLIKPFLEVNLGKQEPKEQRDKRWPIAANLAVVVTSLILAEVGAVGWTLNQGDVLSGLAVINGALLGLYAAGIQILGYEGVKNLGKLAGG